MTKKGRSFQKINIAFQKEPLKVLEACRRNYGHYPNVIGVGAGIKYKRRKPAGSKVSIHFYVRKKIKRVDHRKKLPTFVYERLDDGTIEYSRKLPTDVIELRQLRFACKSGSEIDVIGESGAITLVFKNRAAGQSGYFLLTCAHVAGNVLQSPPVDPSIRSSCCKKGSILANTVVNSIQHGGVLDYDIALARITPDCSPQPEHQVVDSSVILRSFMPSADIRPGLSLSCAFPKSNIVSATVSSFRTSLPLLLDGREYQVNNLYLINRGPQSGTREGCFMRVAMLSEYWLEYRTAGDCFTLWVRQSNICRRFRPSRSCALNIIQKKEESYEKNKEVWPTFYYLCPASRLRNHCHRKSRFDKAPRRDPRLPSQGLSACRYEGRKNNISLCSRL